VEIFVAEQVAAAHRVDAIAGTALCRARATSGFDDLEQAGTTAARQGGAVADRPDPEAGGRAQVVFAGEFATTVGTCGTRVAFGATRENRTMSDADRDAGDCCADRPEQRAPAASGRHEAGELVEALSVHAISFSSAYADVRFGFTGSGDDPAGRR